jgi:GTPase SAR1 family protein
VLTLAACILCIGLLFIYGPSGSGKTTFIKDFLYECENHFDTNMDRIVYIYSIWHGLLDCLRNLSPEIEFVENIFADSQFFSKDQNIFVVYDDLIIELASSSYLTKLCTKNYTKFNLCCVVISQLLFHPGEPFKSLTSNATNIIFFKHRRSK